MPFYKHSAAGPGQVLYVRSGRVLEDYGKTRVTDADYGNGILAAIAYANASGQAGDAIMCGQMRAALVDATLNVSNVRLYGAETEIIRSGNYAHQLKIVGDNNEVRGFRFNGQGVANTGFGYGVWITGARAILEGNEVSGQRGTTVTDGHGTCVRIDGDDAVVKDFTSRDAGYAALSMHNADRLTVDGANILDPHRALAITGTVNMDWINLRNIRAYRIAAPTITADGAYLNMNISDGVSLGELRMTNVSLEDGDMISAGVSYNDVDGHQMAKIQNARKVVMDNVQLLHGTNQSTGTVRSIYLQAFQSNLAPEELIMRGCTLADAFVCSEKIGYFHAEDTYFGSNHIADYNEVFYRLYAKNVLFHGCTFNLYTKDKVFAIYGLTKNPDAANDRYEFRNNRFIGSKNGDQYVFAASDGSSENGSMEPSIGKIIFDKTNSIVKTGTGAFKHSDTANEELCTDTDSNGDLLFDGSLGRHPAPGAGPSYFTSTPALTVPANGKKIWNVNYDPAAVSEDATLKQMHKGWIANGGTWKRYE
jgi:hypothetical protein